MSFTTSYVPLGIEFLVNTQTNSAQAEARVGALSNGGFVAAWSDFSPLGDGSGVSVKAQRYDFAGARVGGEFLVNTQTTNDQSTPDIAGLGDGGSLVTWTDDSGTLGDNSSTSVKAQLFNAAGGKIGSEFLVNTQTADIQIDTRVARLDNGGFVIAWSDLSHTLGDASGYSAKAQLFDALGTKVGAEFLVNTATAHNQDTPAVSALAGGGFVVTWEDASGTLGDTSDRSVKAQVFSSAGAKVGTEFLVNTTTSSFQGDPQVAGLSDGRFVVTWVDTSGTLGDNSASSVKAQLFNATGAKLGTEFLVNTETNDAQGDLTVVGLASGGFIIAWQDSSGKLGDSSIPGVTAQVFDAAGAKIGSEFLVNTQTASAQFDPSVTPVAGGGFVVSWVDGSATLGDSSNFAIHGQMYQPLLTGDASDDSITAPAGSSVINALGGNDSVTFGFKLTDATISHVGNKVIIDTASSHSVITGAERFVFTDGTVDNNDGNRLVDDLFYYAHYHDVWNAKVDADQHFNTYGWKEGRDPSAFFDTSFYLSVSQDVRATGANPLLHFDADGWKQGRMPSYAFDPAAYLAANPDVAAAHIDPLAHYLQSGYQEGRIPIAGELIAANGFDYGYYLEHNADVAAAGVDPLSHFQTFGWKEGRNPNALFDTKGYLATYADVKAAGANPLDHYHQYGWHEGRDPSVSFDTTSYLSAYPDVQAAQIDPLRHFLDFGVHEGRSPFADGVWG